MRLLVQRVKYANVKVNNEIIGKIDNGFLVFLGITHTDTEENADYLVQKLINLRVFEDENEKMNLSIQDIKGELLIISQFTLYADTKKSGNRPSFTDAAKPEQANELYEYFIECCKKKGLPVATGSFGAMMEITFTNMGPVTIILECVDGKIL